VLHAENRKCWLQQFISAEFWPAVNASLLPNAFSISSKIYQLKRIAPHTANASACRILQ
jgi:hypothetical protein